MSRRARVQPADLPALFACVAEADKAHLAEHSTVQSLKKAQLLWADGDPVQDVIVVRTGCLGATLRDDSGSIADYVTVAAFPPDQVVARSLALPKPALMDVRALVASTVLRIPLFALRPIAQHNPELYEGFSDALVRALHHRMYYASRLGHATVERRLARVLWDLSRLDALGRRIIDFKLGQAELAQLVGTDRSELSRRNQLLVKSGMLVQTEGTLELTPSFRVLLANEPGTPGFELDALKK